MTDDPDAVLTVETANGASYVMEDLVKVNGKGFSIYKLIVKGATDPGGFLRVTSTSGGSRIKPVVNR